MFCLHNISRFIPPSVRIVYGSEIGFCQESWNHPGTTMSWMGYREWCSCITECNNMLPGKPRFYGAISFHRVMNFGPYSAALNAPGSTSPSEFRRLPYLPYYSVASYIPTPELTHKISYCALTRLLCDVIFVQLSSVIPRV
jgi:hypothetical protein